MTEPAAPPPAPSPKAPTSKTTRKITPVAAGKATKVTPAAAAKVSPSTVQASTPTRKISPPASAKATASAPKATAPYDDLKPAPAPPIGNIPWGYGDNRVCAMARDPQWAFAYWEITDDGIREAQNKVNDPHAGLSLRVYDTTHRDFNGLNAHSHWDLGVDRGTSSYYFKVGRPGATIHVDIGVRTWHGNFYPIARSGAVEMPRDAMSAHGGSEASTVLRSGAAFTYRHRYVPPPPPPGSPAPPPHGAPARFEAPHPAESERFFQHLAGEGWSKSEWSESLMDGRIVRFIRWAGPVSAEHLEILKTAGSYHRIEVLFQGERKVVRTETGERVVYGPWKVVLEAVGHQGLRRTIEQWMIKRRWTTEEGVMRVETPAILTRILGGKRVTVAQSGSELRLAQEVWGSEMMTQGASEWRWIGASENLSLGSSEIVQQGSSETLYIGASETAAQGSSEWLYLGASETFGLGASERLGSSDSRYLGSSENTP